MEAVMKKTLISVLYAITLLAPASAVADEDAHLRQVVKAEARRVLELAREEVLEDLAARVPRLARDTLSAARPRPNLPGALVVEWGPFSRRAPGR
jgi:hypothetical protein